MARFLTGNMTATHAVRGPDFYATPYGALAVLMQAEGEDLPRVIWEPACGNGALVIPLRNRGYYVIATDKHDWGCPDSQWYRDFLNEYEWKGLGIVTNPPFSIAKPFIERACALAPYVAILARLAFLESDTRFGWFERLGLRRLHIISDRLPMLHRHGYEGPKLSNAGMCFAWFCFEPGSKGDTILKWHQWKAAVKAFPMIEKDIPPKSIGRLPLLEAAI